MMRWSPSALMPFFPFYSSERTLFAQNAVKWDTICRRGSLLLQPHNK
jgi:hypothetical protein